MTTAALLLPLIPFYAQCVRGVVGVIRQKRLRDESRNRIRGRQIHRRVIDSQFLSYFIRSFTGRKLRVFPFAWRQRI